MGTAEPGEYEIEIATASRPYFQAQQRPPFRRKTRRYRRTLQPSTRTRAGPLPRRKIAAPSSRSHSARPAAQEGTRPDDDARLPTQRHDDALGGAQYTRRQRDRNLPAQTDPPTVRPKVLMHKPGADCSVVARKRGNGRGAKGAGHLRRDRYGSTGNRRNSMMSAEGGSLQWVARAG